MLREARRPSPALVIAVIALIFAVGGGTYAFAVSGKKTVRIANRVVTKRAPGLSVDHANTADTATTANTANTANPSGPAGGDLTGTYPNPQIGALKVTTANLADSSVNSAKIQNGQVRAADLGPITTVSNSAPVANTANVSVTATCPAGTTVIAGGFQPGNFGVEATSSIKSGNGWLYQAKNNSGAASTAVAFAYCLSG